MRGSSCPSGDRLEAYQAGRSSKVEIDAVSSHLCSCSECVRRREAVRDSADPQLAGLRAAGAADAQTTVEVAEALARISRRAAGEDVPTIGPGPMLHKYRSGE